MPRTKGRAASLFDAPAVEEVAVEPSEPDPKLQSLQAAAAAKAVEDEQRKAKRRPDIDKPEGFDHKDGIKSRDRVQSIAEVKTAEREVNAMLDLIDDTVRRPNSRVLEPACDIGVFNATTMDSAIFAFHRFENASLHYAGGGREQEIYGGFDSYASAEDVIGART